MARSKGTLGLSSNIEPSMNAPLDARTVVNTLADLTASASFPYFYEGMLVSVKSERKAYQLIGNDPTVLENWQEIGSGESGTTDYPDLTNKPQIGGVTLVGNKTLSDLGAAASADVPTELSQLTGDATHRTVTDAQIAAWNNAGGAYSVLTLAEYNALTDVEKTNGTIYFINPDEGAVPYEYVSAANGTCIVRINEVTNQTLWFFKGWNQSSTDVNPPAELAEYVPSIYTRSHNYPNEGDVASGWIGFYDSKIRAWDSSDQTTTGTMYGVLDVDSTTQDQDLQYFDPTNDTINNHYMIYYKGNKYSDRLMSADEVQPDEPSGDLPEGYTQLECIEMSGTQYIDTGIVCTNNTKITVDALVYPSNPDPVIFGSGDASTNWNLVINSTNWTVQQGNANQSFGISDSQRHTFILDQKSKKFTVDTTESTITLSYPDYDDLNILIGRCQDQTSPRWCSMKLYSFSISENSTLAMELVPAKRESDGEIGMYDTVSATFFTSAGTGSFVPDYSHNLPAGYTELEYIQSTGTQYIDTDYVLSNNSRIDIDCQVNFTSEVNTLWGCYSGSGTYSLLGKLANDTRVYIQVSDISTSVSWKMLDAVDALRHYRIADYVSKTYKVDDTTYSIADLTIAPPTNSVYVMANHRLNEARYTASMMLYEFLIYENGTPTMDLVPAKRNSDDEIGVYDIVNNTFLTNAGTGSFVAGPVKLPAETTDITVQTATWSSEFYGTSSGTLGFGSTYEQSFFYATGTTDNWYEFPVTNGSARPLQVDMGVQIHNGFTNCPFDIVVKGFSVDDNDWVTLGTVTVSQPNDRNTYTYSVVNVDAPICSKVRWYADKVMSQNGADMAVFLEIRAYGVVS